MGRLIALYFIFAATIVFGIPACAQQPDLVVDTGHFQGVNSVALSPDGRLMASGGSDGAAVIWEVASGLELRRLVVGGSNASSVAFSPDGTMLAVGSDNHNVTLWDVVTGKLIRTFSGHTDAVDSVAFSQDGATLVSGGEDDTVRLWSVATGQQTLLLSTSTPGSDTTRSDEGDSIDHNASSAARSVAFSPDGRYVTCGCEYWNVLVWDTKTGARVRTFHGDYPVNSVAFAADSTTLAAGLNNSTIMVWDTNAGTLKSILKGHADPVNTVTFSPDGKTLASGSNDGTIKLWSIPDGKVTTTLDASAEPAGATGGSTSQNEIGNSLYVQALAFTADGQQLAVGTSYRELKLWDLTSDKVVQVYRGHTYQTISVAYSPNGNLLAVGRGPLISIWNLQSGRLESTLSGHSDFVWSLAFSPDGAKLVSGSDDDSVRVWDVQSGKCLYDFAPKSHSDQDWVQGVAFVDGGRVAAAVCTDGNYLEWKVADGSAVFSEESKSDAISGTALAASRDGRLAAVGASSSSVFIVDTITGDLKEHLVGHSQTNALAFSPDGLSVADAESSQVEVISLANKKVNLTLRAGSAELRSVAFSRDGALIAAADLADVVWIWNAQSGSLLHKLQGDTSAAEGVTFSPDGKTLATADWDGQAAIWDFSIEAKLADLTALDDDDWVVTSPDGFFDGSDGGMSLMHYEVGLEPIELSQLKDRYYRPNLLAILLGNDKDTLPNVPPLSDVKLYPDIRIDPDGANHLKVTATNRGGGIGAVRVYVNNVEWQTVNDPNSKGAKIDPNAPQATFNVDLTGAPLIPGIDNTVRVVAYNQDGYLASRGTERTLAPSGTADTTPPDLWAIVGGINRYSDKGNQMTLHFSAQDAQDMAKALTLGAKPPLISNLHLMLLCTSSDPNVMAPTKKNFQQAFEDVAARAKPNDILVVYLSGHGVALSQPSSLYCYPTQDATTLDSTALSDPAVLQSSVITSEDLRIWMNKIPALKKVLVLDTCAAGAAADQFAQPRNISGDAVLAMELMKDRTGLWILMGCAADQVSYEASQYSQGLLTYALLEGMRGPALEDGEYVDVGDWFHYADTQVQSLAQDTVGGVQEPRICSPEANSFPIGDLKPDDIAQIPLHAARPLVLKPHLQNADPNVGYDDLNLSEPLRQALGAGSVVASRGTQAAPVYVDADAMRGGILPIGTYTESGQNITVHVGLVRDGHKIADLPAQAGTKSDVPGLVAGLAAAINTAALQSH